jgi:hypothetical protein
MDDRLARNLIQEALDGLEQLLSGGQQAATVMTEILNRYERGEALSPAIIVHLREECERVATLNARGQATIETLRKKAGVSRKRH